MKILGLIPARKGSKGIIDKNIIDLGGLPLIEHTFKTASNIAQLHTIALSTDSVAIKGIAARYENIDIPFTRPMELCSDAANVSDVALHALNYYRDKGVIFTHIALFQPTSPFRSEKEIVNAIECFNNSSIDSIFSVNEVIHHPSEYITISDNGFDLVMPTPSNKEQRQSYEDVYFINGSFYMCTVNFLEVNSSFLNEKSIPIIFSKKSSFDIDDEFDLELARNATYKTI
tara:strand:- start:661 stop:1350 length:690 start_codon:yes stop_codon:yes gene_type:complete